jgi:hypothetical protein
VDAEIISYIGKSQYTFHVREGLVEKEVHWYLMSSSGYQSVPQREEFFTDSGYYKFHEAYHLLQYPNEQQILKDAYAEYKRKRHAGEWPDQS